MAGVVTSDALPCGAKSGGFCQGPVCECSGGIRLDGASEGKESENVLRCGCRGGVCGEEPPTWRDDGHGRVQLSGSKPGFRGAPPPVLHAGATHLLGAANFLSGGESLPLHEVKLQGMVSKGGCRHGCLAENQEHH